MSHFLSYALHYFIVRVIFDTLRGFGVKEWALAAIAVVALVVLHYKRRRRAGRRDAYRTAYERERGRLDARRQDGTR